MSGETVSFYYTIPVHTKICPRCGEEKALAEFGKNRSRSDGLSHYCILCHRAHMREVKHGLPLGSARPRPIKPGPRTYRRTFQEDSRAKFHSTILRKYGVNAQAWASLLIEHSGRCAGCLEALTRPFVDHCHTTGKVRGLLCQWCNAAVGHAKDEPHTMRRLAEYLERAGAL